MTPTPSNVGTPDVRSGAPQRGLVLAFALCVGGAVASLVLGLGHLVSLATLPAALTTSLFLLRRRDGTYLEFVLWLWLLTPELRRVVDSTTGWHELSPIMVVAPLASLVSLPSALAGRRRLTSVGQWAFGVTLVAIAYGFLVGVVRGGVTSPAAALLVWLPPVALGLYVAAAGPSRAAVLAVLRRTAVIGSLVLGAYGLVQYFFLPSWDGFWMQHVQMASIGLPEPTKVRVFSLLNSPGPFATVIGLLLVLLIGARTAGRLPAALVGMGAFGLSLVRMAWLGLIASVATIVLATGSRSARRAVVVLALPVALLLSVEGPVSDAVGDRITNSVDSGKEDVSLSERRASYTQLLPAVASDVLGRGLGASGVSTKVGNRGELGELANIDSGFLEYLFTFGALVGSAALVAAMLAALDAFRRSRRRTELERAAGAALVGVLVQIPFGNPLLSVSGVFFWVLIAALSRADEQEEEPSPTGRATPFAVAAH